MEFNGASERQLKDIFDLGNDVVTNDVLNSFQDYIADGFDAFEKYIRDTLYQNGQESTALKMILAVEQLHNLMQESERRTSKKLEGQVKESVFFVPEALALCALQNSEKLDSADLRVEEDKLDRELQEMRADIASTRAACEQLQSEIRTLDEEIATCDVSSIQAIPDALGTDKENFAKDADAVNKAGKQLNSMLPKLKELSQKFGSATLTSTHDIISQVENEIQKRKESQAGRTLKEMCNLLT
ncbi:hypothetical protein HOP50_01g03940 [Chloropicon primus]|uniref:Uncharacterized protein n=1 Tax=Chloropicon primus TaxID=1764295 RepID=A0A5B8MQP9_9CHLO|nr:hypothetical protein A3770_01p04060 [Chloropicon primus]QDZ23038.1 hypothetical protein A3770_09p55560 [Chloropicon primus]UPQ97103.1 hypothetical protein HOP50_01g03940 [Chloropicon primus]|eukprot:QDZ17888.1 hypothetical protein A3770_01p04060 [Chloropicon primus]